MNNLNEVGLTATTLTTRRNDKDTNSMSLYCNWFNKLNKERIFSTLIEHKYKPYYHLS